MANYIAVTRRFGSGSSETRSGTLSCIADQHSYQPNTTFQTCNVRHVLITLLMWRICPLGTLPCLRTSIRGMLKQSKDPGSRIQDPALLLLLLLPPCMPLCLSPLCHHAKRKKTISTASRHLPAHLPPLLSHPQTLTYTHSLSTNFSLFHTRA